jgi:drug/metabolite transporter (DMT)-like permease
VPSNDSRALLPVFAMLVGASMWGVVWYPMRLLEAGGLQGLWLSLLLYGTALLAALPRTWRTFGELGRNPAWTAVLIATAGWTNVAFILAVLEGNVLRVLLLFYLSPVWATLLAWAILRERVGLIGYLSLGIAMVGAVVMLWNPTLGAPWPQGRADWLALSSGVAFAVSIVATRRMQEITVAAKVMCVWLGVVIVAGVMIAGFAVPLPRIELSIFAGAVALGIGGIVLMTLFVQYGVTYLPVHRSAVLALIELVAGAVSQQLLTDEVVTLREWIGGALIVVGAYLSARAATGAGS